MDALLDYLDDIEEVLETSKKIPFGNRISVEKERILDIINDIRLNLPDDIRHAQRILGDHDRIVAEAQRKAQDILDAAESEAKLRASNHEIFRRASDQAAEIMEQAKKESRDLRMNANDYMDDCLAEVESQLKELMANMDDQNRKVLEYYGKMIDRLFENREQLRGR